MKVRGSSVGRSGLHAFDKADNALFHHFGRQAVRIRLERIRRHRLLRINGGEPLMRVERIREDTGNQIFRVLVLEMDQMARAVERESVLSKGPAKAADL